MLQSSLSGVMNFMSAFTSFDSQQQLLQQQQQQQQQQLQRTRHSSAASTNQDSFSYYPTGLILNANVYGYRSSLYLGIFTKHERICPLASRILEIPIRIRHIFQKHKNIFSCTNLHTYAAVLIYTIEFAFLFWTKNRPFQTTI